MGSAVESVLMAASAVAVLLPFPAAENPIPPLFRQWLRFFRQLLFCHRLRKWLCLRFWHLWHRLRFRNWLWNWFWRYFWSNRRHGYFWNSMNFRCRRFCCRSRRHFCFWMGTAIKLHHWLHRQTAKQPSQIQKCQPDPS